MKNNSTTHQAATYCLSNDVSVWVAPAFIKSNGNVEVIDCERHGMKRRVKEALYINAEKHSMNKDKGLELNPIWFSFFP